MNILTQNNQQSMTSQQIADLVEKRHDNVKRTIEKLVDTGVIAQPHNEDGAKSANGVVTQVYVFIGEQGKRDSFVVVAQLSPKFTGRLVDRWQELENQVSASSPVMPALPHDYISALEELLVTKKGEHAALEQVKELKPKADALDTLSHAKGALGIRETAITVGIPERKFIARCTDENKPVTSRFMYRDDKGKLRAYSHRIKQGFMTQKITSYAGKNGHDLVTVQVKFTAAGIAHIAKMMQNKPAKQLRVV